MASERVGRQQQRPMVSYHSDDDTNNEEGEGNDDGSEIDDETWNEGHDTKDARIQEHENEDDGSVWHDVMKDGNAESCIQATKDEDQAIVLAPVFFGHVLPPPGQRTRFFS
mmetsp:Transcript_106333/g.296070  ORF Transcript_106333/g.296070 Transcript_106333/m.296070 type:complete len:111 (+) Transcript_106333:569-901(+)